MTLKPGAVVASSLTLIERIGRGAMGSVWLAKHHGLQSNVAVKFMAPHVVDDPVSVARFKQEARAAAEIRSPHVVQTFDHGITEGGQPYIVMELLEGESLGKRSKRDGPLGLRLTLAIVTQVAKALARAHERGIYHRDVKPENIFLLGAGEDTFVKVLDFGVAKFVGEEAMNMTATGNMVGTPAYMSPEQLFGLGPRDHRCDLWALAVVAYYSLIGVRPFDGLTIGELCASIRRCEFELPSKVRSDLSARLDEWFVRAFHTDVDLRFESAKQMAVAFEKAIDATTVMSSAPSGVHSRPIGIGSLEGTAAPSLARASGIGRRAWLAAGAVTCAGLVGAYVLFGGEDSVRSSAETMGSARGASESSAVSSSAAAPQKAERSAAVPSGTASDEKQKSEDGTETMDAPAEAKSASATASASASASATAVHDQPPAPPIKVAPGARRGGAAPDSRAQRAAEELGL